MDFIDRHGETIRGEFDSLNIRGCSDLVFEVTVRGERKSYEWERLVSVSDSPRITFQNSDLASDDDQDHGDDIYGLFVTNSPDFKLLDSKLHDFIRGAIFSGVDRLEISGNEIHDIRSDGLDFVGVRNAKINRNLFRDFTPSATDHADAIQFWTVNEPFASEDVEIEGNTFLLGDGVPYQCIFVGTKDKIYRRFTITENVMYVGHWHGITIERWEDCTVEHNTVLTPLGTEFNGSPMYSRIIGGEARKNIAAYAEGDNLVLTPAEQAAIWPVINGRQDFIQHEGYGATISAVPEPEPAPDGRPYELSVVIDGETYRATGTLEK